MITLTRPIPFSAALLRASAVTALFGAAMLVSPLMPANADASATTPGDSSPAATSRSAAKSAAAKQESLEDRIASLHKSLKITADEEPAWTDVAQTMRDNEAAMQKLVEARNTAPMQKISAVDDLKIYEGFTQAHDAGLKKLIASFETLYGAMPDAQKAIADQVFQQYGHKGNSAHK
jgi:hypothetical protein